MRSTVNLCSECREGREIINIKNKRLSYPLMDAHLSVSKTAAIVYFICTYIHNWPLQPFSQDYGLASHTTYVVCVNFIQVLPDRYFFYFKFRALVFITKKKIFFLIVPTLNAIF